MTSTGPDGGGAASAASGTKPRSTKQDPAVLELQRRDDDVAGDAALGAVDDAQLLVGQVGAGRRDGAPLDIVGVGAGQDVVERRRRHVDAARDLGVERLTLVEPAQLPEPEVDHQHDAGDHEQVEGDPARGEQEPVHASGGDGIGRPLIPSRLPFDAVELPRLPPARGGMAPRRSSG